MTQEEMSLTQLNQKYNELKKQQPQLTAKLNALIAVNEARIRQIQQSQVKIYGDSPAPTASTVNLGSSQGGSSMNNQHPVTKYLGQQKQMLLSNLKQLEVQMEKEASQVKNIEAQMKNGLVPNTGPKTLQANLAKFSQNLQPGNLGDINRVVWPFWYTTEKVTLVPNTTAQGNITVTQEAAFIWLQHTKAVFLEDPGAAGNFTYIDPMQPDGSSKANGLTMTIRDSSSSRTFMNTQIDINQIGSWYYPTILPTPQLLLPNSNVEFNFSNSDQNNTYRVFLTVFGLRVRIEDAQNILSTLQA